LPDIHKSVSFIGSGNVAYGLGMELKRHISINKVWSRSIENASKLASKLDCSTAHSLVELHSSDFVIVAVSDSAIAEVGKKWCETFTGEDHNTIIAHTSGNVSSELLNPSGADIRFGVLYPLQSFTYGRRISLKKVPFFIHGSSDEVIEDLCNLTGLVSKSVNVLGDQQRMKLHLPAVIVNNLVNHLVYLAEQVVVADDLKIDYFIPLMEETIKKIKKIGPLKAQTGPARRNDVDVMCSHLNRLEDFPELKEVYNLLSNSIINLYHEDNR